MLPSTQKTTDLVTLTGEIVVGKFIFGQCKHIVLEEYTSTVLLQ